MFSLAQGHEKVTLGLLTLLLVFFFYGLKFQFLIFFILVIFFLLSWHLFFFRDPDRKTINNPDLILAPADGKIYQIDRDNGIIRIRMSLFDVHITRVPISGNIVSITFDKGRNWPFISFLNRGTTENSRQIIQIKNSLGSFNIIQIVGIIARYCRCYFEKGEEVQQGSRLGIIYYGSEVDIQFPSNKFDILVREKQKTIAGMTPLARIKEKIEINNSR
ncbi:MAG: phosphatidylserine decarboxylase [Candidatus Hodarchaeota archaeon]